MAEEEINPVELLIEFENTLSWIELREIVQIIDDHFFDEIEYYFDDYYEMRVLRPYPYYYPWFNSELRSSYSFIEIKSVSKGSIVLWILGGAGAWTLAKLADGATDGKLGKELARSGELLSDIIGKSLVGDKLERLNDRLEKWSERNHKLRKKKRKARLKNKRD